LHVSIVCLIFEITHLLLQMLSFKDEHEVTLALHNKILSQPREARSSWILGSKTFGLLIRATYHSTQDEDACWLLLRECKKEKDVVLQLHDSSAFPSDWQCQLGDLRDHLLSDLGGSRMAPLGVNIHVYHDFLTAMYQFARDKAASLSLAQSQKEREGATAQYGSSAKYWYATHPTREERELFVPAAELAVKLVDKCTHQGGTPIPLSYEFVKLCKVLVSRSYHDTLAYKLVRYVAHHVQLVDSDADMDKSTDQSNAEWVHVQQPHTIMTSHAGLAESLRKDRSQLIWAAKNEKYTSLTKSFAEEVQLAAGNRCVYFSFIVLDVL
jgi:hypothetical protein